MKKYFIIYKIETKEEFPLASSNRLSAIAELYVKLVNFANIIDLYPNLSCSLILDTRPEDTELVSMPVFTDKCQMMQDFIRQETLSYIRIKK